VDRTLLGANPQLVGLTTIEVYLHVIQALERAGVFVILDNHVSDGNWCCSDDDHNGLWYNSRYSEATWLDHWRRIVDATRACTNVVAAELRNELRLSCGFPTGNNCRAGVRERERVCVCEREGVVCVLSCWT
jgi:endoglucanase